MNPFIYDFNGLAVIVTSMGSRGVKAQNLSQQIKTHNACSRLTLGYDDITEVLVLKPTGAQAQSARPRHTVGDCITGQWSHLP